MSILMPTLVAVPGPIENTTADDLFKPNSNHPEIKVTVPVQNVVPDAPSANAERKFEVIDPKHELIKRAHVIKRRIIRLGLGIATAMQIMRVGGFLLEHGVAFYAYSKYAPTTLWGQYFYANAAHEATMKILGTKILGFSVSSVATSTLAVISAIFASKLLAFIYNRFVEKESKISISVIDMISEIFHLVF